MLDLILSPFEYTFMQKAFLISIGIAIPMSIISCYLILKGWALMGDAISHAILPGIVISYIFGIALSIGAFFAGLLCALTSGYIKNNSKLKNDSILGIVFSGMFALGLILYLKIETDIHLDHILFGNILGLSWNDVINSIALGIFCALFIYFQRFDLMLNIFDSQHATAIGFNVKIKLYFSSNFITNYCCFIKINRNYFRNRNANNPWLNFIFNFKEFL